MKTRVQACLTTIQRTEAKTLEDTIVKYLVRFLNNHNNKKDLSRRVGTETKSPILEFTVKSSRINLLEDLQV